jgi:hypothetical protein
MEILNIDYVGPYPDGGYALVVIDCFSRWNENFPVDSASREETAVALLQHFGRFGASSQIRSDRGSHFVNSLIREFSICLHRSIYTYEQSCLCMNTCIQT